MTHEELLSIRHHQDWDDGRLGYLYTRFDAFDPNTLDRAEVTWDDDEAPEDKNRRYSYPQLLLQTNRRVGDELIALDSVVIDITEIEARYILSKPLDELKKIYHHKWAKLRR